MSLQPDEEYMQDVRDEKDRRGMYPAKRWAAKRFLVRKINEAQSLDDLKLILLTIVENNDIDI